MLIDPRQKNALHIIYQYVYLWEMPWRSGSSYSIKPVYYEKKNENADHICNTEIINLGFWIRFHRFLFVLWIFVPFLQVNIQIHINIHVFRKIIKIQ